MHMNAQPLQSQMPKDKHTGVPGESAPAHRMKGTRQGSPNISFRLQPDEIHVLAERAARLGVSRHELARHYVVEALAAAEELAAVGAAVSALHHEMLGLRQDLALSVEALLASAGEVSEKQAHTWVEASLNRG